MTKVLYQGIEGSYSEIVARDCLEANFDYQGMESFSLLHKEWESYDDCLAVLPIENTLVGSILENIDFLPKSECFIEKEINLSIQHSLLCHPKCHSVQEITKVYSHPKALEQCQNFLNMYPHIKVIEYYDTAGSAQMLSQQSNPFWAAVASEKAGILYNLKCLKKNIQDNKDNFTRFVILRKNKRNKRKGYLKENKCSFNFKLPHEVGSLAKILEVIARKKCNLTRIESRPIKNQPFEYEFFIDLEWKNTTIEERKLLLEYLETACSKFLLLGTFSTHQIGRISHG